MPPREKDGASSPAGIILYTIACVLFGYGLCLLVHELENGIAAVGVGAMLAGVAAVLTFRRESASRD